MDSSRKLSKEEELLRERQRSVDHGITGYSYDEVRRNLLVLMQCLFPLCLNLITVSVEGPPSVDSRGSESLRS